MAIGVDAYTSGSLSETFIVRQLSESPINPVWGIRNNGTGMQETADKRPNHLSAKRSTARTLLQHAGTWVGDDLEECLKLVYDTRGEVEA